MQSPPPPLNELLMNSSCCKKFGISPEAFHLLIDSAIPVESSGLRSRELEKAGFIYDRTDSER